MLVWLDIDFVTDKFIRVSMVGEPYRVEPHLRFKEGGRGGEL